MVRRAVRWPLMKPSVGVVVSVSGAVVWAGSGVLWGQRGRVTCWVCAWAEGMRGKSARVARARAEEKVFMRTYYAARRKNLQGSCADGGRLRGAGEGMGDAEEGNLVVPPAAAFRPAAARKDLWEAV